jgi:hypothetical protein
VSWHLDEQTWTAYAGGQLNPDAEAAVEQHVTSCPRCRTGAPAVADVGAIWTEVHTEITRPRPPWPLRLLAGRGIAESDLVVVSAARDLLRSWSVAVGCAILCAVLTALVPVRLPGGPPALFLIIAPLIPVVAVVAAYDATDPFREVTETTPYSKLRLALLRTAAALTAAIPLTVAVAVVVPALHGLFAAWLLPGLALTVTTLILLTWLTAWIASAVVGAGWLVVASALAGSMGTVATGPGQAGFALVLAALLVVLVRVATTQPTRGVAR